MSSLEQLLYGISQLFLGPVLLAVLILFGYAFHALGAFLMQAHRRLGSLEGHELLLAHARDASLTDDELEALALKRMERARIVSRVAPMLGLVATMIPMGPALQSLADGQFADMSRSLTVAFSAVILALIAAAITYATVHVRRRWYAQDLLAVQRKRTGDSQP